jgi:hypothetical protein
MTMKELIERLELATGWDRALDMDIARACPIEGWRIEPDGSVSAFDGEGWYSMPTEVPTYTHSIDAAASLAPPGWAWFVEWIGAPFTEGRARLWIPSQRGKGLKVESCEADAKTPALAVCIAALKAREAERAALAPPTEQG